MWAKDSIWIGWLGAMVLMLFLLFHNPALIFTSLGHQYLNDVKPNLPFEQGTTIMATTF
jgi:hypothetical protein